MPSGNITTVIDNFTVSKSIVDTLNQVSQNFVNYLPLIFSIFGLIGFIGNLFTYLQPELRSNTCCIYSLCGSIIDVINLFLNLFPSYLSVKYGISIPWNLSSFLCKLNIFLSVFLPHLSINFLLMAIIDRFAATCSLTSPLRRLNQLKMVLVMIIITVFISCLASCYPLILMELYYGVMCLSRDTTTMSILYIILIGVSQPTVMLIFVLLTYRNIQQSRQRVVSTVIVSLDQNLSLLLGWSEWWSTSNSVYCDDICTDIYNKFFLATMDHHVYIFCCHFRQSKKC